MSNENQTPQTTSYEKIGNNVKVTVRPAGSPEPTAAPAPTTGPVIKTTQPTKRYQTMPDGSGVLMTSSPTVAKVAAGPSAVQATAMNAHGQRISLSEAGPEDVIDLGGSLGSTKAKVWAQMGELVKLPSGGYARPGQESQSHQPAQQQEQPKPQEQPVTAADLKGVQPTSDAVEATLRDVQEGAPAQFERMIEQAARGKVIDFDGIARDMGVEGGEGVEQMVTAHREAGIAVLRNLNVDPLAFERHLMGNPDLASTIIRSTLKKDMAPLVRAARAYSAERAEKVARIATSKNVPARVENGVVYLNRAALGLSPTSGSGDFKTSEISEAEARRLGVLEVNE